MEACGKEFAVLSHYHRAGRRLQGDDVKRAGIARGESLALADGVERDSSVLAANAAAGIDYLSRSHRSGRLLREEGGIAFFRNEAYLLAVRLVGNGDSGLPGDPPGLLLALQLP